VGHVYLTIAFHKEAETRSPELMARLQMAVDSIADRAAREATVASAPGLQLLGAAGS
jgi:hypothetical protein